MSRSKQQRPAHSSDPPEGYVKKTSTKTGNRTINRFVEGTAGNPRKLHAGSSLGGTSESIITLVKQTNTLFSNKILSELPQGSRARKLFAGSAERTKYNLSGNPLPKTKVTSAGNNTSLHTKHKTGSSFISASRFNSSTTQRPKQSVANGRSQPAIATDIKTATKNIQTEIPTPEHTSSSTVAPPKAVITSVAAATGMADRVKQPNSTEIQTAITSAKNLITNTAVVSRTQSSPVLPLRQKPSSNAAANASRLVSAKEEADVDIFGMRFNQTNYTQTPIQQGTPKKRQQKQKADIYMSLANVRRGLPEGANLSEKGIRKSRAEAGLPSAPLIMGKQIKRSLTKLNQESNTNTKGNARLQLVIAAAPAAPVAPVAPPPPPPPPPAPVPPGSNKKHLSTRAHRRRAARDKRKQQAQQIKQTLYTSKTVGPFANPENISKLAQKQGLRPTTKGGILKNQEPMVIVKTVRRERTGKKTMKKIAYDRTQKQKLLRKLKKAEAAAGRGSTFFEKVLGGFGFYPGKGKDPNYIAKLQSKIQNLDNSITKGESRLEKKLAVAQNNVTRKNLKAKQKAINRTKFYRDLMAQYYTGETTGEIEVNTHRTTNEANAIKKERAEKKTKKTNILAITNPTNNRAKGINNSMRSLFANTLNLRNANITTSTDA